MNTQNFRCLKKRAHTNNYLATIPDLNRASKSEQGTYFFILKELIVVMFFHIKILKKVSGS